MRSKRIISAIAFILIMAFALQTVVFAEGEAQTITEDGEYVVNGTAPLDIDGCRATIVLDGANIASVGRSAIIVKNGADVTFVLNGENVVTGDSATPSCGIEVELGSSVTFEGDGMLTVTGGEFGAAIGSYGTETNIPEEQRRNVGEITINSGTIIAYAGRRGSGIGSGYHVSGNLITINGGTVYAYGRECGAGIGSGYGTSGGAHGVAAVGEYDSGRIVINGGVVYASANYVDNIDSFNYGDLAALNAADPCTFAAGIGGGYGSSASDIEIVGGHVFALGSGGGAGIGGGRGTSKAKNYNETKYTVSVKIGGNAEVIAVTADSRTNEINSAGAAIGSGRGTHTGGTIEITGNAAVTAISATEAPAIGASKQQSPYDGAIPVAESIVIGDNVQLFAASAGSYAVDKDASNLSINDMYFGSSDRYFFGEDAASIDNIANVTVESTKGVESGYVVPQGTVSLWTRIKAYSTPGTATSTIQPGEPEEGKVNVGVVTPIAMAVRFFSEDGESKVYYNGDTIENLEVGKTYRFRMITVDWDVNNGVSRQEKKAMRRATRVDENGNVIDLGYERIDPAAIFQLPGYQYMRDENGELVQDSTKMHAQYKYDDGSDAVGLEGTVVYSFTVVNDPAEKEAAESALEESERAKSFYILKDSAYLRTDVNKCFMAYRFYFEDEDFNKGTGIDNVVLPKESLSVNLPLGTSVTVRAYENVRDDLAERYGDTDEAYEQFNRTTSIGNGIVFIEHDPAEPGESWTTKYWEKADNGEYRIEYKFGSGTYYTADDTPAEG